MRNKGEIEQLSHIINTFKAYCLFCFVILCSLFSLTFVLIPFALLRPVKAWEFHTITKIHIAYMHSIHARRHINTLNSRLWENADTRIICVLWFEIESIICCFNNDFSLRLCFLKCRKFFLLPLNSIGSWSVKYRINKSLLMIGDVGRVSLGYQLLVNLCKILKGIKFSMETKWVSKGREHRTRARDRES